MLFSVVAVPIYIPTNRARGFPFLHTLFSILFVDFLVMNWEGGIDIYTLCIK